MRLKGTRTELDNFLKAACSLLVFDVKTYYVNCCTCAIKININTINSAQFVFNNVNFNNCHDR